MFKITVNDVSYQFSYYYNTYTIEILKPPYPVIYEGIYTHILSYNEMKNIIESLIFQ